MGASAAPMVVDVVEGRRRALVKFASDTTSKYQTREERGQPRASQEALAFGDSSVWQPTRDVGATRHLYEPAASSTAPLDVVPRSAADACREERNARLVSYYTLSSQNPSAMSAVRHSAESPSKSIDLKPAVFPAATFVLESSTKHTTSLLKSQPRSLKT